MTAGKTPGTRKSNAYLGCLPEEAAELQGAGGFSYAVWTAFTNAFSSSAAS
jgi:hypothetical protein